MRLARGFVVSILLHILIFTSGYYMLMWWKNSRFSDINIDLTSSSLMLRPARPTNKKVQPEYTQQEWFIGAGSRLAAVPVKVTVVAAAAEEPEVARCPAPCPDIATDWVPEGATSRRPVWVDGAITEDDYPKDARAQGLEGRVRVEIFIDAAGKVRNARVIQSSNEKFSAVVLEKLKKSRFEPALDKSGRPIAVHMAIPIVFELH
jgi:TonB family protein